MKADLDQKRAEQLKAIASEARVSILTWLQEPAVHFPKQETGDPDDIGVCVTLIAKKLNMSQPTTSRHLDILRRSGLLTSEKVQSWSFFKRNDTEIKSFRTWLNTI